MKAYQFNIKQERKLTSASRSFYTLAGRYRGSIVCTELFTLTERLWENQKLITEI